MIGLSEPTQSQCIGSLAVVACGRFDGDVDHALASVVAAFRPLVVGEGKHSIEFEVHLVQRHGLQQFLEFVAQRPFSAASLGGRRNRVIYAVERRWLLSIVSSAVD